ncbi:hypothetical protein HOY80DRAFT_66134 [Tuber brumale]|nr:hypothetical protein HOY80DRAFT_66134 [Tuber brumale]
MSSSPNTSDPVFRKCWNRNACNDCLSSIDPTCGWCPFTQTCVPATFTTPLHSSSCPSLSERWEMRTAPLGCQVSMITLGGVLVGVVSALVIVLLVAGAIWTWRRRRGATADAADAEEGDGLLGASGRGGTEGEGRPGLEGLRRRVSFWVYNAFLPGRVGADTGAGSGAGRYGTMSGGGAGGYGSDGSSGSRGGSGGGGVERVDSTESFGSGGLDGGFEERRRVLERG